MFDNTPLSLRYWTLIVVLIVHSVAQLFCFFLVGFLISIVGPIWHLTYGHTSIILLSGGVGQIIGAMLLSRASDQWGRKPILILSMMLYALSAGAVSLIPDGGWRVFSLLQFVLGLGYGGVGAAQLTLIVEITPTRYRTLISSASGIFAPLGVLVASVLVGFMLPIFGWRGVAALGFTPVLIAVLLIFLAPESVRWLLSRGENERARKIIAQYLKMPVEEVPLPEAKPIQRRKIRMRDLYSYRGQFWAIVIMATGISIAGFGVQLWGPTIISLLLKITPSAAARYFIWISLAGVLGRLLFSILPATIGRWKSAMISSWLAAVALACAAVFHSAFLLGLPVFFLCLLVGALAYDGGFVNIVPYSTELYPVHLAGQGTGLCQACSGLGKLIGPAILALVAGAGSVLSPKATSASILPGFLLLSACCAAGGVALSFLRYETHGKPMVVETEDNLESRAQVSAR
jgi:putative MFS transporter